MKTKFALVLSGGGFKGAFQAGALNYLKENWHLINPEGGEMKFDIIAGVSVGSLNGAMMAMDKQGEMNKLWQDVAKNGVEEIYTSDFIDTKSKEDEVKFKLDFKRLQGKFLPNLKLKVNLWKGLGLLISKKKRQAYIDELLDKAQKELKTNMGGFKSIADNTPLRNKLEKLMNKKSFVTKFMCGFVSLDDGVYHAVSSDDFTTNQDLVKGILASTSMPVIWNPVQNINFLGKKAHNAVDGGIKNVSPLGDVIGEINKDTDPNTEYVVVVINCSSGENESTDHTKSNIGQIALRSLNDIAMTEVFNNDIDLFIKINNLVAQVEETGQRTPLFSDRDRTKPLKSFKSIIIQPSTGVLGDTLTANKTLINTRLDHGRHKAEEALNDYGDSIRRHLNPIAA